MSDGFGPLEWLRGLLGLDGDGASAPRAPRPPHGDGPPPDCEEVDDVPCEEAARRVYEYLDGELDAEDAEEIRCHVEQCQRCYPMFNWEELFLKAVRERGGRPESSDDLRRRVAELLDREAG